MRRILTFALLAALALAAAVPVSLVTAGKAAAITDVKQGHGSSGVATRVARRGRYGSAGLAIPLVQQLRTSAQEAAPMRHILTFALLAALALAASVPVTIATAKPAMAFLKAGGPG